MGNWRVALLLLEDELEVSVSEKSGLFDPTEETFKQDLLMHNDAKYQFLFKNSILMKSIPTLNLNFPAKNGIIEYYII